MTGEPLPDIVTLDPAPAEPPVVEPVAPSLPLLGQGDLHDRINAIETWLKDLAAKIGKAIEPKRWGPDGLE